MYTSKICIMAMILIIISSKLFYFYEFHIIMFLQRVHDLTKGHILPTCEFISRKRSYPKNQYFLPITAALNLQILAKRKLKESPLSNAKIAKHSNCVEIVAISFKT